jgi:hypothetical protein
MRFTLQLVMHTEGGHQQTVEEIAVLKKDCLRIEHLGLTLAEVKQLLTTVQ